eukprot:jgi/Chlat1/5154/Chrsp33S05147
MASTTMSMAAIAPSSLSSSAAQRQSAKALRPAKAGSVASVPLVVRAQQDEVSASASSRRSVLGLIAGAIAAGSFTQGASALERISIDKTPAGQGVLKERDTGFDVELDFKKERFSLGGGDSKERLAKAISAVEAAKTSIEKKTWWDVQSRLRTSAGYLRFDIEKLIAAQPKEQRVALNADYKKIERTLEDLDYNAQRLRQVEPALQLHAQAVSSLNALAAKLK